ncbi:MAG: hypothetical protein GX804_07210 [Lentisphaerae bacterium]|nr:hypothetical protein [Lentisphaerota bacterium]
MLLAINKRKIFSIRLEIISVMAVVFLFATFASAFNDKVGFERFTPILERNIFGPPPPVVQTNAVDDIKLTELEDLDIIPPGFENVRVTLISRFNGIPAAGFNDQGSQTSYYLLEGQKFEDFELLHVDLEKAMIRLKRQDFEMELPLWINPATTNQADVTTFGMPAGSQPQVGAPVVTAVRDSRSRIPRPDSTSRDRRRMDEERAEWRAEALKRREEARRKRQEEMAAMTPEEREQRLRDINTDIIIKNQGPPLPIELNERDMKKLSDAGFDIPGFNPETEKKTDAEK